MTTIESVALCGALTLGVAFAASSANAALVCGPGTVEIGNPGPASGRVISTYVAINNGVWTVQHKLADGTVVDRSTQYTMQDVRTTIASQLQWRGGLFVNPSMVMVGQVDPYNGQELYQEWLWQNNRMIMHSTAICAFDGQHTSAPVVAQPEPQQPVTQAPTTALGDFVPLVGDGTRLFALVTLGTQPSEMMKIDTGASSLVVTNSIANALIAKGEATEDGAGTAKMADGSVINTREITITRLAIGNHVLTNVPASVAPDTGGMLIGLPVLNQFGRFTIDTANRRLIFG